MKTGPRRREIEIDERRRRGGGGRRIERERESVVVRARTKIYDFIFTQLETGPQRARDRTRDAKPLEKGIYPRASFLPTEPEGSLSLSLSSPPVSSSRF